MAASYRCLACKANHVYNGGLEESGLITLGLAAPLTKA